MANKKHNLPALRLERLNWKTVLEDALIEEHRDIFIKRKKAVDMYIDGINLNKIREFTNIDQTAINRFVSKCCKINPITDEPYGYSALIPYSHINKRSKIRANVNNSSKRGLFETLLLTYPSLISFIHDNYFSNKDITLEKNMKISTLHKKLLIECKNLGIQDYEYPFRVESKGFRSLHRFVNKLRLENEKMALKRESKNSRQKYNSTGKGHRYSTIPLTPYSVVQLDGHKIDMIYTIPVTDIDGSTAYLPATRMWLIAVIDVATRAILGYSLSTEQNYNQTNVLAALKDAMHPRHKIDFTIPGFSYPENGGYPCFAIEETKWAIFDTIMFDNAESHLAHDVVNKLTLKLKCSVNFGPVSTPETRGIVERFFGTLEENGYHRVVSTTGSNIQDVRRENAEKDATKYNITFNDIVELTEYLIALYNNSPHSALSGRTPLQVMGERICQAGMIPFIADHKMKETIKGLTNIIVERTVRGAYKSGKRPYISYVGVEYRNEAVSISASFVGTKIFLEVDPDDISSVLAYTEDGIELGYLRATGIWGKKSHSLKTRKEALAYARKNKSENNPFYAILTGYENELKERAIKSRNARTKKERINREQATSNTLNNIYTVKKDVHTKIYDSNKLEEAKKLKEKQPLTNIQLENLDGLSFEEAYAKGYFK